METTDTKLALDEIKLNLERNSNNVVLIIPVLAFTATVLMVIFTLLSEVFFHNTVVNHIIFLSPDIYTLVTLLGVQLPSSTIAPGLFAAFTTIFSIAFIATMVLFLYKQKILLSADNQGREELMAF